MSDADKQDQTSLIPSEQRGLIKRSSSLIRRSLASLEERENLEPQYDEKTRAFLSRVQQACERHTSLSRKEDIELPHFTENSLEEPSTNALAETPSAESELLALTVDDLREKALALLLESLVKDRVEAQKPRADRNRKRKLNQVLPHLETPSESQDLLNKKDSE